MKKENTNEIFQRKVTENLMNVIFEKRVDTTTTPEENLLEIMNVGHRIKVQSVALPIKHQLFTLKTEEQVLDWLQNKIHSQYSAFYQINKKYKEDAETVNWNNNKMQNQRFLETKNLYKDKED